MKKVKTISLAVTLAAIIAMSFAIFALPAGAETEGYYTYTVSASNSEAKITYVNKDISGYVTIPSTLGGYPVTSIYDYAFDNCDNLIGITIPDSVKTIGKQTFHDCDSLQSITIPDNVKSIGLLSFQGCDSLKNVTISKSVTSIGNYSFTGCPNLDSITVEEGNTKYKANGNCLIEIESNTLVLGCKNSVIPDHVTSIGENAFSGCTNLASITIPEGITSIGKEAFYGCTALTEINFNATEMNDYLSSDKYMFASAGQSGTDITVNIGANVSKIPAGVFQYCSSIASIVVEEGNIVYHSSGNCLIETATKTLVIGCKNSVIPTDSSVTSIGSSAFSGCTNLTSITIPEGVTSIGSSAFFDCTSLESVTISEGVASISNRAFSGCTSLESITIPKGVTSIGSSAFSDCTALTSVTIGNSVESIGDYAFYYCSSMSSIIVEAGNTVYHSSGNCLIETASKTLIIGCNTSIIPSDGTVTSIGNYAFRRCYGLKSITIPDGVIRVGSSAFRDCKDLQSVTIPDSVMGIGSSAFSNCKSLTSITIPENVESIDDDAFYLCTALTEINFNATAMGDLTPNNEVFYDAGREGTGIIVNIGANVTKIPINLFNPLNNGFYAPKIISVVFAENSQCESIGKYAFHQCVRLESIIIPNTVTSIGDSAFECCTRLVSITIPEGVTSIGNRVLYECSKLTNVTISDSVTSIGERVLDKCTSLEKIHCPEGSVAHEYALNNSIDVELCSGGEITCMIRKKCTVCGNEYGDKALGHDFSVTQHDATHHWKKCSCCTEIDGKVEHVGGTATCTTQTVCTACGTSYGEALGGHDFTVPQNDVTHHWTKCSRCEKIDDKTVHIGGSATCTTQKICTDCGVSYGEALGHDFTVPQNDATHHWTKCNRCTEIDGKAEHTGGTATCTTQKVCTDCGASYGEALGHDFTVSQNDSENHWNKCSRCDETDTKQAHTFGNDNKCTVCEYQKTVITDDNTEESETTVNTDETKAPDSTLGGCSSTLGGAAVIIATLGMATAFIGKKKKSDIE